MSTLESMTYEELKSEALKLGVKFNESKWLCPRYKLIEVIEEAQSKPPACTCGTNSDTHKWDCHVEIYKRMNEKGNTK